MISLRGIYTKGDNNKEIGYTIRMDDATLRRLKLYCEKMGMLKSQAIREAINALPVDDTEINKKE